jgi:hypothetical protein
MLALKKKREAEAKQAAEAAAVAQAESASNVESEAMQVDSVEKISLLGIGGKKAVKNGGDAKVKKRTPGEIRIQKGTFSYCERLVSPRSPRRSRLRCTLPFRNDSSLQILRSSTLAKSQP